MCVWELVMRCAVGWDGGVTKQEVIFHLHRRTASRIMDSTFVQPESLLFLCRQFSTRRAALETRTDFARAMYSIA